MQFSATNPIWVQVPSVSNVKSDKKLVVVKDGDEKIETGLKKFGAMLGDNVEVGCGSVIKSRNCDRTLLQHLSTFLSKRLRTCKSHYKSKTEVAEKRS